MLPNGILWSRNRGLTFDSESKSNGLKSQPFGEILRVVFESKWRDFRKEKELTACSYKLLAVKKNSRKQWSASGYDRNNFSIISQFTTKKRKNQRILQGLFVF
jgi:hypothetical protein